MTSEFTSRKHGPFDTRYPPRERAQALESRSETDRSAVEAWEAEGGLVRSPLRHTPPPATLSSSELTSLPDGLTWETFAALVYPGTSRHYFPAIGPWLQYRDSHRSAAQSPARPPRGRDPTLPHSTTIETATVA
jgi:hypothetical protein